MLESLAAMALLQAAASENPSAEPEPAPAPSSAPCASEQHRALDFWIGEWEVFDSITGEKAGESRIQSVSGGCAVRETWMPMQGPGGTSVTLLNHRNSRWEQLWIGGDGRRVDFIGGPVGETIVLTGYWDDIGGPGKDALIRMTFAPKSDGSVRQAGQASGDHGQTWRPFFDFTYRPKAGE